MSQPRTDMEDVPLRDRLANNPRPALIWVAGAVFLLALELGALANTVLGLGGEVGNGTANVVAALFDSTTGNLGTVGGALVAGLLLVAVAFVLAVTITAFAPLGLARRLGLREPAERREIPVGLVEWSLLTALLLLLLAFVAVDPLTILTGLVVAAVELVAELPTLLSRNVIPNQGYQTPDGTWHGTFLGLSPAVAWGLRAFLVYAYVVVWLAWLWRGYNTFREHYRAADWTPKDDIIDRFRGHYWGIFGMVVVVFFLVMAIFAPPLSTAPLEENQLKPYSAEFEYYNEEAGEVQTITHGEANEDTLSGGNNKNAVGVMEYDQYDRFHPVGTTPIGKDMFTYLVHGARMSLFIGLMAIGLGTIIAAVLALATAYYKGLADLATVVASDSIQALPFLLVVMMVFILFKGHPLSKIYNGGLLFALVFGGFYWPALWRAVRGPSLQIAEQEWIDAAKSYGQRPAVIMRKHMAPYIVGYLLIYASLSIGGVVISVAALSYLGIGISAPTPEWGRLISNGEQSITTDSWHVATVPGIMITLLVLGFNAFGDGIRDALDPQAEDGSDDGAAAAGGGG
jgi:peptide/nickel transport system permease protein